MVGDGRKPALVLAQGEQQVRDPVGRGQAGIGRADAKGVYPPPAPPYQERAGLAHEPHAHRASLDREAGLILKVARGVAEQIAEQALGHPLRLSIGLAG